MDSKALLLNGNQSSDSAHFYQNPSWLVEADSQITWNYMGPRTAKTVLKKWEDFLFLDFRTFHKAIVIKAVWYQHGIDI